MNFKHFMLLSISVWLFCLASYLYLDIPTLYLCRFELTALVPAFQIITLFGYGTCYFLVIGALVLYFKFIRYNRYYFGTSLFIFTSIILSGLLNSSIKYVLGRYRPNQLIEQSLYGFSFFAYKYGVTSFPSGHANLITALMLSLYFVFPRFKAIWLLFALLVISSRVIVGAHYVSDVVFGSYLAILTTFFVKDVYLEKELLTL